MASPTKEEDQKLKNIRHNGQLYTINEVIDNLAQEKKQKNYVLKANECFIKEVHLAFSQLGRLHVPDSVEEMARCAENYCLYHEFHENDRKTVRIVKNHLNEIKFVWTKHAVPLYPNYFGRLNKNALKYPPPVHPAVTSKNPYSLPAPLPQQMQLTTYYTGISSSGHPLKSLGIYNRQLLSYYNPPTFSSPSSFGSRSLSVSNPSGHYEIEFIPSATATTNTTTAAAAALTTSSSVTSRMPALTLDIDAECTDDAKN